MIKTLYSATKVYFDGSHYIGIPHTTRKVKYRPKPPEEIIEVKDETYENLAEENIKNESEEVEGEPYIIPFKELEGPYELPFEEDEKSANDTKNNAKSNKNTRKITKKELFNELYRKYSYIKKKERRVVIYKEMLPYFKTEQKCKDFVDANFERVKRNLICKKVRMIRKANLAKFNYFCTFTYDDKKHTENTFKKKLRTCFRHFTERKKWKYMGVWERAPKTNRLHFHGLFNIPDGTMPGEIIEVKDYDTKCYRMQTSYQNTYFNERFGRSDFKEINPYEYRLGNAIAYLIKYLEKSNEKIVYSKNLPMYFVSDILEDDIICPIGLEDKKILLSDKFKCLVDGEYMGEVSEEVIEKMPKAYS